MSQALCFNEISFTPVTHQNSLWICAVELARALGYKDDSSVRKIYERNADEFTPDMTQVIEISERVNLTVSENLKIKTRIFSLRGCHLLAMFARTPVAKQFRRWVLDVIEQYGDQVPVTEPTVSSDQSPSSLISVTPSSVADRKPLRSLVNAWARVSGQPFDACWSQVKAAFRLTDIRDLPQEWIPDAIAWVQAKIDALPKALPSASSTPPVIEDRRIPDAMAELRKLVMHCGRVRNIIHIECHPGAMSFSMSAKEREVHYAFQGIYQTAVDNICAATHALDACLKLRAIYPARG